MVPGHRARVPGLAEPARAATVSARPGCCPRSGGPAGGPHPSWGASSGPPGGGRPGGGQLRALPSLVLLKNPPISNFVVRSRPVLPVVFLGSP